MGERRIWDYFEFEIVEHLLMNGYWEYRKKEFGRYRLNMF